MKIARLAMPSGTSAIVVEMAGYWVTTTSLGVEMTLPADLDPAHLNALSIAAQSLSAEDLTRLAKQGAATVVGQFHNGSRDFARILAPLHNSGKIIAVGLNYRDHIAEVGATIPEHPVVFGKYASAITGPFDPVAVDFELVTELDYEVELGVVIGTAGRDLHPDTALEHVAGYMVVNDLSSRNLQFSEPQWIRSKSFDGFCPVGPWLTTPDEVPDPQNLELWSTVNGEPRQQSNTKEMVFSVGELLAFCSQATTLHPGDLVITGTPPGVAMGLPGTPWLRAGDVVECGIAGLGSIRTEITAARPPRFRNSNRPDDSSE